MNIKDIRSIIAARPFRPIELRTADGQVYRVASPEIMVSRTMTVIMDRGEFRFVDNANIVSLRRTNGR